MFRPPLFMCAVVYVDCRSIESQMCPVPFMSRCATCLFCRYSSVAVT